MAGAWLNTKIGLLGKPVAALINSGVQLWRPIDGTSIVSRTIDEYFQDTKIDQELPRRTHRFASSTLRMPALAGDGQVVDGHHPAILAAILAIFRRRAIAPRMGAFVSFLFGHDPPPCLSVTPP
jgi:hypothetical protein